MERNEVIKTLEIARDAGKIMMENGAEVYRVEDTITRICKAKGLIEAENFCTPTGIFLSCLHDDEYYSYVERCRKIDIDLEIIALVNDFSRKFVSENMPLDEAKAKLEAIANAPHFSKPIVALFGGIAAAFFTLLFGGGILEFVCTFITSVIVVYVIESLGSITNSSFVKNAIGGGLIALVALTLIQAVNLSMSKSANMDQIIIGSLMPLVPGVAFTNALRDLLSGDFLSGMSKLSEALIVALAIAGGVGAVLHMKVLLTGGF